MITIDKLTERKSELIEARFNAQRLFNQLDGRIQEIDAMIDFCKNSSVPAQTGIENSDVVYLGEGDDRTITTP